MKQLTIKLSNIQNCIRTKNSISSATHDLALYLMLKYNLFRSDNNTVYSFTGNTLKYVDLRAIINEELAPVQANTSLVNNVTSYFMYIGSTTLLRDYNKIAENPEEADTSIAGLRYKKVNRFITEEVKRLADLEPIVHIE